MHLIIYFAYSHLACVDTESWINKHGHDCNTYAKNWCEYGGAKTGKEVTLGSVYNYPENNCCVCGKDKNRG